MNVNSNTSPLETVASYAIAFLAGAITVTMTAAYGNWRAAKGKSQDPRKDSTAAQ
jgi:hypothetical protein